MVDRLLGGPRVALASPGCMPAFEATAQRLQVAADGRVGRDDERLGEQRARRGAAAQHAVAAQQVAAAEARLTALRGRAVAVGDRAEVHADRVGGLGGRPAGAAQAQREVEDLHVCADRLVEAPDLLPRGAPVGAGGALRAGQRRARGVDPGGLAALHASEAGERDVGAHAEAVDRAPLTRGEHQRRHRADALDRAASARPAAPGIRCPLAHRC